MNIFRDVPVYKFNSDIVFSPDNDLKRPLAAVILCTHAESVKSRVYITLRKEVELSITLYNFLEISREKRSCGGK